MKKLLIILGSILLVIMPLVGLFLHVQINKPYSEVIYMNWSIILPNSYKEIYMVDSGASFHGDGERYHIFKYTKEEDTNLSVNWENNKSVAVETEIEKVLNNLKVSKENMPNFQNKYKYYTKSKNDFSKIYLIFFTDTKELYIIEDIL